MPIMLYVYIIQGGRREGGARGAGLKCRHGGRSLNADYAVCLLGDFNLGKEASEVTPTPSKLMAWPDKLIAKR